MHVILGNYGNERLKSQFLLKKEDFERDISHNLYLY